jgi:hypothetical protein
MLRLFGFAPFIDRKKSQQKKGDRYYTKNEKKFHSLTPRL